MDRLELQLVLGALRVVEDDPHAVVRIADDLGFHEALRRCQGGRRARQPSFIMHVR